MATFTLSGSGTHAITAGTGALHVHVTTLPTIRGAGRAEPTNYYDLGLLRLGDGTYWWPSIPIDAEFQLLGCPQGTLEIAYALFNGTELSVVEVAGSNPLAGSRTLEDLSDVLIASVSDGQVLKWNAAAAKWENGGVASSLTTLSDVLIASVANGQVLTWNASAGKWENQTPAGGGLSSLQDWLAADINAVGDSAWHDVLTRAVTAGTWIIAPIVHTSVASQSNMLFRIYDGTTTLLTFGNTVRTPGDENSHSGLAVVTISGSPTLHLQYFAGAATFTIRSQLVGTPLGDNCTGISLIQIA